MSPLSRMRRLLWPASFLYGLAARLRAWLYAKGVLKQRRLNAPVISVGNISVGGTGKTPMVVWLAKQFLAEGQRVAILTRGYRGSEGSSDEVELMRQHLQGRALFGVGKNRYQIGQRLAEHGVDIFLLDDGFQHLQLARDLDIVLIDATRPVRQETLIPAGSLREPASAVNRADLVIFTRSHQAPGAVWAMQQLPEFPVFPARTKLIGFRRLGSDRDEDLSLRDSLGSFYAFCGIGNPEAFFRDLDEWRIHVVGHSQFRDHHRYSAADVTALELACRQAGAQALVTTEKDEQNLVDVKFALPVYVTSIAMEIPDEQEVLRLIKSKISPQKEVAA